MSIKDSPKDLECDACIQAKQTRAPLPKTVSCRDHVPGELTHTDVWGPACVPSVNGYRYYISFVDDATRHVALYYMKTKDKAPDKVKHYLTYIKCQGEKCPKAVRADNRRGYVNNDLIGWCHTKGIELQTIAPCVTVHLISHRVYLFSFLRRTHLLWGLHSYDWYHCMYLIGPHSFSLFLL
jgi:hypothetical protein